MRSRTGPRDPPSEARPPTGAARPIGRLYVISGPSGVGKGTVVRALLASRSDLEYSLSFTTRPPRPGEVDGVHYRFVDADAFERLIDEGAFLEHAEVFGHHYGTPAGPVVRALADDRDVVLEVDIQGAGEVRSKVTDAVLVFLLPPSEDELVRRLRARRTETEEELARRLARVRDEIAARAWFGHEVVNDEVDRAAAEVAAIIDRTRASDRSVPS